MLLAFWSTRIGQSDTMELSGNHRRERHEALRRRAGALRIDDAYAKFLRKAFASAHINVLLGSAFSINAVPTLGERESWFQAVDTLVREHPKDSVWGTARGLLRAEYFKDVMLPLLDAEPDFSQLDFASTVTRLVAERGTTTLPRRVNFFTTNYDPMIELSLEELNVPFNDGFTGRVKPVFDPPSFSRLMCEQSLFMEYTSQVATANVLKAHGSLTWRRDAGGRIAYSSVDETLRSCYEGFADAVDLDQVVEVGHLVEAECDEAGLTELHELAGELPEGDRDLIDGFTDKYDSTLCIVNPAKRKFEETVLEQSYYDLLRIYANELDRNNALLLVFGFSFADEHILELTKRAIRSNPKLIVLISCHTRDDAAWYRSLFPNADNVYFIAPDEGKEINAAELTEVLRCVAR